MNLSIKQKINLSFSLLVLLFVINGIVTIIILNNNKKLSKKISEVIDPSLQAIGDFEDMMVESKMYSTNWVFLRSKQEDKNALIKIHFSGYKDLKTRLNTIAIHWSDKFLQDSLQNIYTGFEQLLQCEKEIMSSLQNFEDYDDPVKKFGAEQDLENIVLPVTTALMASLNNISTYQQDLKGREDKNLDRSSIVLRTLISFMALLIICIGIFLSIYMSRMILQPLNKIRHIVNDLGKGIINLVDHKVKGDEMGQMVRSVNNLSRKLEATAIFAAEVGKRNFKSNYEPMGPDDNLGKAIIAMRDNLKSSDQSLNEAQHIAKMGSWERDFEHNKLFWSDELFRIFDFEASAFEVDYSTYIDFIHPDDQEYVKAFAVKYLHDHQQFTYECRIITRKGIDKIIFVQGKVLASEQNEVLKTYGIIQDITARRKAEDVLIASNLELKKSNMELDRFVYSVSHDLRAPLLSMQGIVEITEDATDEELSGLYESTDDNSSIQKYKNKFNGIPVDYVEVTVNKNRQKTYGGSLQLNWKWSFERIHGNAYASLSYVNGVFEHGLKEKGETVPDEELEFISPCIFHAGIDLKRGKFSFSPRLILMGKQQIMGIGDTTKTILQRQTIPGYALLNLSVRYNVVKSLSVFVNVTNALNRKYRNVGNNMDLKNKNPETNYGQPQDPIRVMAGLNVNF